MRILEVGDSCLHWLRGLSCLVTPLSCQWEVLITGQILPCLASHFWVAINCMIHSLIFSSIINVFCYFLEKNVFCLNLRKLSRARDRLSFFLNLIFSFTEKLFPPLILSTFQVIHWLVDSAVWVMCDSTIIF